MHVFTENVPPTLKERMQMTGSTRRLDCACCWIESLIPRLCLSDKVENLDILAESKIIKFEIENWRLPNATGVCAYCLNAGI